ncbi:unnamed protein product [Peronospora destructor]|uniref:Uncharacterized protein n=1 Tax=Peronospora destructor TaxID=86335 RepID=A0AAV0SYP0_9STRA|nr:unnamed protein product [Peronospora destructor]
MSLTPLQGSHGRLDTFLDASSSPTARDVSSDTVKVEFSASKDASLAFSSSVATPEHFLPPMSFLRRVTSAPSANLSHNNDPYRRKEIERNELLEMILESIANVPKAVERIHTNEKLRQALHEEMGEENALLHQFFDSREQLPHQKGFSLGGKLAEDNLRRRDPVEDGDDSVLLSELPVMSVESCDHSQEDDKDSESGESEDRSSGFSSEYENDLTEAVKQLRMTNETLTTMDNMISEPIAIVRTSFTSGMSERTLNSPQSSFGMGALPGATSMDGEPVSALWPRQPDQFAFTQEEDNNVREEDEVYSETASSVCEDDTFQDGVNGDEKDVEEENLDDETEEKLFQMDEDDDVCSDGKGSEKKMGNGIARFSYEKTQVDAFVVGSPIQGQVTTFQNDLDGKMKKKADTVQTIDIKQGDDVCDDAAGSESSEGEDGEPKEYEVYKLRIIREKNRTGFEPNQDWRPRAGTVIGNRYKVGNGKKTTGRLLYNVEFQLMCTVNTCKTE